MSEFNRALLLLAVFAGLSLSTPSALAQTPSDKPFTVEYYYKARWGSPDEFLRLFKKNHYPLLKKQVEMGRMLKVSMDMPRYHATEDGRWDYRVTIVFKNSSAANDPFAELQPRLRRGRDQAPDQGPPVLEWGAAKVLAVEKQQIKGHEEEPASATPNRSLYGVKV